MIMTAESVRAILAGTKTMTRRIVQWKPREPGINLGFTGLEAGYYHSDLPSSGWVLRSRGAGSCWNDRTYPIHCPYGKPGDRLWVREVWAVAYEAEEGHMTALLPSGKAQQEALRRAVYRASNGVPEDVAISWRSPIFMPRWASRITLEITSVVVERLECITEAEARAEGVTTENCSYPECVPGHQFASGSYRGAYAVLWNKLNGKRGYPWGSLPWVWALSFKRIKDWN